MNQADEAWMYVDHEMLLYTAGDADKQYIKDRMKNNKYKHARVEISSTCSSDAQTSDSTVRRDRGVVHDTTQLSACEDRD